MVEPRREPGFFFSPKPVVLYHLVYDNFFSLQHLVLYLFLTGTEEHRLNRNMRFKTLIIMMIALAVVLVGCGNPAGGETPELSDADQNTSQLLAMVRVDGGVMRSSRPDGAGENTTKPVEVSSFYIGTHEVTQEQYFEIMGIDARQAGTTGYIPDFPSEVPPGATQEQIDTYNAGKEANEQAATLPMYDVSWYEAIIFANRLSIREGLTPVYAIDGNTNPDAWGDPYGSESGSVFNAENDRNSKWNNHRLTANWSANGYRLPTNAEWSWAAMGGVNRDVNESAFSGATGSNSIDEYAWHSVNTPMTEENPFPVRQVGSAQPNAIGIYDMSGNVWEWVWDWQFNWYPELSRSTTETVVPAPVDNGPVVQNHRGDYPTTAAETTNFFANSGQLTRRLKFIRGGSVNEVPTDNRQFAADLDMTGAGSPSPNQFGNANTNYGLAFPYSPLSRNEIDLDNVDPGSPVSGVTQYIGFRLVRNAQ